MVSLGLDTSGAVSVALAHGGRVLAERTDTRARHHDEVLLPLIDAVLDDAGISREQISRVVVGRGPGPFTGLRVGLVTARSIAEILGAELEGVTSVAALAHEAAEDARERGMGERLRIGVALDARRKEVYWALFEAELGAEIDVRALIEPMVSGPAQAADALRGADVIVGSGAHAYPDVLPAWGELQHAHAGALIRAAERARARGEDIRSSEPLYLREADASRPTRRKSALGLGDRAIEGT